MLRLHIYFYKHVAQEKSQDSFKHITQKCKMRQPCPIFISFASWQKLILTLFYNYISTKYMFQDTTLPSNTGRKPRCSLHTSVKLLMVNLPVNCGEKPSDICVIQNEIPSLLLYKTTIQTYSSVLKSYATICQCPYLLWLSKLQLCCAQSV